MSHERLLARGGRLSLRALRWASEAVGAEVVRRVGGPARTRVVLLLGATLALSGADASTVGAMAPQIEPALHIGNAGLGLLGSVPLLVGALFVVPAGVLVDRVERVPLLSASVVLWSAASLFSAFAGSFSTLLLTRLALGAVDAFAGPAIASLMGDYFAVSERGRVYSYVLAGEIAGTAAGFIVSGTVASLISWRASFVLLAIPGMFLARSLARTVPEPLRGGQSQLAPGVQDLREARAGADRAQAHVEHDAPAPRGDVAGEAARARGVEPDEELVLDEDPREMGLVAAIRFILRIPTNVKLILGSSLGYFFFAGLQTFAVLFIRGHYRVGQASAELALALLVAAGLIGTLASGRVSDAMLRRGSLRARVTVPAVCYLGACALLVPGLVIGHLTPALWFDMAGAGLLAAANPPLDAARLDIMPPGLRGRAESTRSLLRSLAQSLAPLMFGGLADVIAGISPERTPIGQHIPAAISPSSASGLEVSFLIMLVALGAAGVLLARARDTYPRDVVTAAAARERGEGAVGASAR
jgi:MFS family permease